MPEHTEEVTPPDFEIMSERFLMEISKSEEFGNLPARITAQMAQWCADAAEKGYRRGIQDGKRLK